MKIKPDWQKENNTCCYFCGTTRSVKYKIDLLNVYGDRVLTVDACNKCALLNARPTEKGRDREINILENQDGRQIHSTKLSATNYR